jgi:hypothetical protein
MDAIEDAPVEAHQLEEIRPRLEAGAKRQHGIWMVSEPTPHRCEARRLGSTNSLATTQSLGATPPQSLSLRAKDECKAGRSIPDCRRYSNEKSPAPPHPARILDGAWPIRHRGDEHRPSNSSRTDRKLGLRHRSEVAPPPRDQKKDGQLHSHSKKD